MSGKSSMAGALLLVAVLVPACSSGDAADAGPRVPPPPADAISKAMQNGPVKATVTVWPPKPMLSDSVYVRLTIEAEPGVSVELPFQTGQLGDAALGRFRVVDFASSSSAEGQARRQEHTYTLQPRSSGRHRIPPFRLEMLDRRNTSGTGSGTGTASGSASVPESGSGTESGSASGTGSASGSASGTGSESGSGSASESEAVSGTATGTASESEAASASGSASAPSLAPDKPLELLTEEIPLDIAPIPVEKITASLQPAHGALSTSIGERPWWLWAALVTAALAWLAAGYALFRRWKLRQRLARQRTAYDDAVAELVALEQAGPPDEHAADEWFVRLSGIIRNYLERRYDIRAPELTTEEFLQQALGAGHLSAEHRKLLQGFLERCDRVKFAAYRPESKESLETLAAARGFVEDTRLREAAGARVAQEVRDAA